MKLMIGSTMPNFIYNTAYESGKIIYANLGRPTFLLFLRYLGCTTCQLDIHQLKETYNCFTSKGAQVLVVLQSSPESIAADVKRGDLPFEIICDPDQKCIKNLKLM